MDPACVPLNTQPTLIPNLDGRKKKFSRNFFAKSLHPWFESMTLVIIGGS